jgi:hypothetical protein
VASHTRVVSASGRASLLLAGLLVVSVASTSTALALMTKQRSVGTNVLATGTLGAPAGLVATGGASVTLTWTITPDTHASGYNLYRGTVSGGPYGLVATVTPRTTTTYSDAPAVGTYQYVLRAYVGNWESMATNEASATVSAATTSTGLKPCSATVGFNIADAGGDGNGYQTNPTRACGAGPNGLFATDPSTGITGRSTVCANPANDRHRFWGYAFGLPGFVTSIDGITVQANVGMSSTSGTSTICIELSWDGGTNWTAPQQATLGPTGITAYSLGGASSTWGRTWAVGEFSASLFRVRVTDASTVSKDYRLDWLAVGVTYTP